MKKILLTLCCYIIAFFAFAQNQTPTLMNVIPPSPEAAALGKYGEIPVSAYTGIPNIDIPLYQVTSGTLSVPISLSYHASGIRVDEIATRVGIGWTLQAGGCVMRTIRGQADEFGHDGFLELSKRKKRDEIVFAPDSYDKFWYYDQLSNGCYDAEPDMFSFNFLGHSGKISFDWEGNIVVSSEENLKVKPTISTITGAGKAITSWEITDSNGTIYTFSAIERTQNLGSTVMYFPCKNAFDHVTTWYISSIQSLNFDRIDFYYTDYTLETRLLGSESISYDLLGINNLPGSGGGITTNSSFIRTRTLGKYISLISTTNCNIEFKQATTFRTDIGNNNKSLDEIIIKNTNNQLIKSYKLGYTYSTNKLTLETLQEVTSNQKHSFQYYPGSLPNANVATGVADDIKSKDHWGFFNGTGNSTLLPSFWWTDDYYIAGADRNPYLEPTRTGTLQRITYPTGGSSNFDYELNQYSFIAGTTLKGYDKISRTEQAFAVSKEGRGQNSWVTEEKTITINSIRGVIADINIEISDASTVGSLLTYAKIFDSNNNLILIRQNSSVEKKRLAPGTYKIVASASNSYQDENGNWTFSATSIRLEWKDEVLPLKILTESTGGLRIKKISAFDGLGNEITKHYDYTVTEENQLVSSGVLATEFQYQRIKEYQTTLINPISNIKYCSAPKQQLISYSNNFFTTGTTQGSHIGYKQVSITEQDKTGRNGKTVLNYTTFQEFPDGISMLPPFVPCASYDHMRGLLTKQVDYKLKNGLFIPVKEVMNTYIDKTYDIPALKISLEIPGCEVMGQAMLYKYAVGAYNNILGYSKLKTTTESVFDENSLKITNTKTITYDANLRNTIIMQTTDSKGNQISNYLKYPLDYLICGQNTCVEDYKTKIDQCYNDFYGCGYIANCMNTRDLCTAAALTQLNTCQTNYSNCLTNSLTQAQQQGHKQTAALLQMQLNNQLSTPIEQWTTLKKGSNIEKVTSALLYNFERHPNNLNLVVQKGIRVLEINEPLANFQPSKVENLVFTTHSDVEGNAYVKRINFDTFDDKGNLLQQNKTDDIPQAYIWGYNKTMPIAQVINATQNEIFHTSFEEYLTGGEILESSAQAKTGNKYLKGTYTVPSITTVAGKNYVLTYFSFEGTEWKYKKIPYVAGYIISGTSIDEVRIYPEGALMTTATYDPLIGKTSETDTNGITTYYEYDTANRLKFIKDQDKNIIQRFTYKYAE